MARLLLRIKLQWATSPAPEGEIQVIYATQQVGCCHESSHAVAHTVTMATLQLHAGVLLHIAVPASPTEPTTCSQIDREDHVCPSKAGYMS